MILHLKIKPNSKSNQLLKDAQGNWVMKVKAPPVDGKANEEVIRQLAGILNLPKSAIELTGGHTNPHKRFKIEVLNEEQVHHLLEKWHLLKD